MPRTWKIPSPSPATATSTLLGTHFSYKQPSSSLKTDFIHTELSEGLGVRRGLSVYSLRRVGETASESWRNWERSQPKSGRTVGGIWCFFGSESMVHFDAINVQCKVSIWPSACLPLCQTFKTLTEADSDGWAGGVDSDRIQNYDG